MTIQDKLNKKGFQLGATISGGVRTGYYVIDKQSGIKSGVYKTQTELLKIIKK